MLIRCRGHLINQPTTYHETLRKEREKRVSTGDVRFKTVGNTKYGLHKIEARSKLKKPVPRRGKSAEVEEDGKAS